MLCTAGVPNWIRVIALNIEHHIMAGPGYWCSLAIVNIFISVSLLVGFSHGTWTSLQKDVDPTTSFASLSKLAKAADIPSIDYNPHSGNCSDTCVLPDCFCQKNQETIPGGMETRHTPQIITFTYTGPITDTIRKQIADIFPTKRKNPNGCSMALTLFVSGTFSDACTVHEMYTRGHEIAIQSKDLSHPAKWSAAKWTSQVADYRYNLSKKAYIPFDHIQGMRAPMNEPGGDDQFEMLMKEDFMYDSTLKAGPADLNSLQVWPFTLEEPFEHASCLSVKCPDKAYPALWVLPSLKLATSESSCTYLDECVADFATSEEIFNLLVTNLLRNYKYNRAPFQVNLLETTFVSDIRKQALKDFLDWVSNADDTWVLTMQEMLSWIRTPVRNDNAQGFVAWDCPNRNYHRRCREESDKEKKSVTYSDFIDVDNLVIWQYVLLSVGYLIVLRYDRWLPNDNQ